MTVLERCQCELSGFTIEHLMEFYKRLRDTSLEQGIVIPINFSAPDILLFGFLFIYLFIARPYQVSGLAMFPNYHNGEYLMTRLVHSNTNLKRGDIVVFHAPIAAGCPVGTSCDFIKRIVGLPGDEVAIQNGFVSINGSKLEERYLGSDMQTLGGQFLNNNSKKIIPLGFYFILGDNRPHSSDSRQWGFVPAQDKTQEE